MLIVLLVLRPFSLWSSALSITSISSAYRLNIAVFVLSLWLSWLCSLSRCGLCGPVIFHTMVCESLMSSWHCHLQHCVLCVAVVFVLMSSTTLWSLWGCHLPHWVLWVAEVFIDVDFITAVFVIVVLSKPLDSLCCVLCFSYIFFALYFLSLCSSSF